MDNWAGVVAVVFAASFVILFLLYQKLKAERRANEQQRLLEEAAGIAKLKQTISSLLDNMPGMNFTKDAETGEYLACNQAFANFANRQSPEEVIGLSAAQLFDAGTAARFAEDDRLALAMDEPFILYEDVPDASGSPRQIKITKLKYTDDTGRVCVLGIRQDVTDNVRIRREEAATKEDYEKARSTGIIYTHIAQALARGYTDLYYINLDTEEYIEYRTDDENGSLSEMRRGWHFFEECQLEAEQLVYPEDRDAVIRALDRKTLVSALDRNDTFHMTYRLIGEHGSTYVSMKITLMKDDDRTIILGVTDVDEQMKQRSLASRMREKRIAYSRLSALAGDYLCIYLVDPATDRYRVFSTGAGFETFMLPKEGRNFFAESRERGRSIIDPDDLNRFLSAFTRENILADVERDGIFTLSYRLMIEDRPRYVQLKAVMQEEKEGPCLIVGINDIDKQVRQEEAYVKNLAQAKIVASVDALTGVKNRHAYLMAEERLNNQIEENRAPEFAVVVLDVKDLKRVNDTSGHEAGDQYLRNACKVICDTFRHSPVFRIGGDEFAVIMQGSDYDCRTELLEQMRKHNEQALLSGGLRGSYEGPGGR
jgi:FOG: GGDEF domain